MTSPPQSEVTLPSKAAQPSRFQENDTAGPSAPWLAAGFLLAGLGTVLLGPILPVVSARWHLTDAAAGGLLFAKFVGAFAGGATVPTRLRVGVLAATLFTALGLSGFALSPGPWTAAAALCLTGFGLGQLIASSNILAGRRYTAHAGSALSTLNFFWSLGAVSTGLLTAWLLPRFRLQSLLFSAAAAFLLVGGGGAAGWLARPASTAERAATAPRRLPPRTFFFFAGLLLLYGGLETSLSSWLPTLEQRYFTQRSFPAHSSSGHALLGGQSALVLLWASITVGRIAAAAALRRWRETVVLRGGLVCAVVLIAALASVHGSAPLSVVCILLGFSLAPWFPATFALLLRHRPASQEAGAVLATSGIGAAVFPWLTGLLSTHTGSLRLGLAVPACLAVMLLAASFLPDRSGLPDHSSERMTEAPSG